MQNYCARFQYGELTDGELLVNYCLVNSVGTILIPLHCYVRDCLCFYNYSYHS